VDEDEWASIMINTPHGGRGNVMEDAEALIGIFGRLVDSRLMTRTENEPIGKREKKVIESNREETTKPINIFQRSSSWQ
jgi:hypothetical protein